MHRVCTDSNFIFISRVDMKGKCKKVFIYTRVPLYQSDDICTDRARVRSVLYFYIVPTTISKQLSSGKIFFKHMLQKATTKIIFENSAGE